MSFFSNLNADNEEFFAAKKYLEASQEAIKPEDFYHLGPKEFANMMHLYYDDWAQWYLTVYDYYRAKVKASEDSHNRRAWDLWVSSGEFLSIWFSELSRDYRTGNYWFSK